MGVPTLGAWPEPDTNKVPDLLKEVMGLPDQFIIIDGSTTRSSLNAQVSYSHDPYTYGNSCGDTFFRPLEKGTGICTARCMSHRKKGCLYREAVIPFPHPSVRCGWCDRRFPNTGWEKTPPYPAKIPRTGHPVSSSVIRSPLGMTIAQYKQREIYECMFFSRDVLHGI